MDGPTREHGAPDSNRVPREPALVAVLAVATGLALYLCNLLVAPFLPALAWAVALAIPTHPVYDWLRERIGHKNLAAGLTVFAVAVVVVVPFVFLFQEFVRQAANALSAAQAAITSGEWLKALEPHRRLMSFLRWAESRWDVGGAIEQAITNLTPQVATVVAGSFWAAAQFLITFFLLFYFYRDRRPLVNRVRGLIPLSRDEADEVFSRVNDTIFATIYGTLAVAAVQGALGGLMFWWLKLPGPLFWGTVMGLLGIVPVLGAFVVWIPAAIYLALSGFWIKALVLTAWGTLVVGTIDNILFPVFVGGRIRVHTAAVFIAVVGGIIVFGASGVILGPVVMAVTFALIDIWRRRMD
ncbi:MAG TPA: AI-2E family transporter [Bryobacteraceae bacterium]|nr:AI-2E family transporter [Bryobacteraceae bacterium]HPU71761.1 AI-2E family transporter [Bryobacteraceae bacterium]